ncbi:MAG: hypothetical protein JSV56_11895, partial [Methanomassiliicoccales archaeon]
EIVDYITGKDLDFDSVFPKEAFDSTRYGAHVNVKRKVKMPDLDSGGWKIKMREGIKKFTKELESMGDAEAVRRLRTFEGVGEKTARGIYDDLFLGERDKRGVDRMWSENNLEVFSSNKHRDIFLDLVKGEIGATIEGGAGERDAEIEEILSVKPKLEGETDEPVTSDVKRLIRLPSSLHGKTALVVTPLSRDDLDDFEPLRDAVPKIFSDEPVKIEVTKRTSIKLRGEAFDLKKGEIEVPEFAAIFLMCRRCAEIVSDS